MSVCDRCQVALPTDLASLCVPCFHKLIQEEQAMVVDESKLFYVRGFRNGELWQTFEAGLRDVQQELEIGGEDYFRLDRLSTGESTEYVFPESSWIVTREK